jgi:hypothetical protein
VSASRQQPVGATCASPTQAPTQQTHKCNKHKLRPQAFQHQPWPTCNVGAHEDAAVDVEILPHELGDELGAVSAHAHALVCVVVLPWGFVFRCTHASMDQGPGWGQTGKDTLPQRRACSCRGPVQSCLCQHKPKNTHPRHPPTLMSETAKASGLTLPMSCLHRPLVGE